jgi:hypothetical protein
MVNSGLKSPVFFVIERRCKAGSLFKRILVASAALTNQTIEPRRHQKLFWPSRFMVY